MLLVSHVLLLQPPQVCRGVRSRDASVGNRRTASDDRELRIRAAELLELSDREIAAEIQIGTHGELGLISNVGPRRLFPMQGLVARDFAKNRTILVGEAAHVVPPIGAQGRFHSLTLVVPPLSALFLKGEGPKV